MHFCASLFFANASHIRYINVYLPKFKLYKFGISYVYETKSFPPFICRSCSNFHMSNFVSVNSGRFVPFVCAWSHMELHYDLSSCIWFPIVRTTSDIQLYKNITKPLKIGCARERVPVKDFQKRFVSKLLFYDSKVHLNEKKINLPGNNIDIRYI